MGSGDAFIEGIHTFNDITCERNFQEVHSIFADRCRSTRQHVHLTTEHRLNLTPQINYDQYVCRQNHARPNTYLFEDQSVPEWMHIDSTRMPQRQFGRDRPPQQHPLQSRRIHTRLGRSINPVQDSRNSGEIIRFQHLCILQQA